MSDRPVRSNLNSLESSSFGSPIVEGGSNTVSLAVSDGEGGGPIYLVIDDRPDLSELGSARTDEHEPINEIGDRRTHGVYIKPTDDKSCGLRVWSGYAVVRPIWDVFWGLDG